MNPVVPNCMELLEMGYYQMLHLDPCSEKKKQDFLSDINTDIIMCFISIYLYQTREEIWHIALIV